MDVMFLLNAAKAVLETIFLCIAVYYAIRGIRTKEFHKATIFIALYLVLNLTRNLTGF